MTMRDIEDAEMVRMARSPRRRSDGNGSMRILIGVFLFLLAVTTAAAVALFTGAISIAQQPPVPTPNPSAPAAAQSAAPAGNGAGQQQAQRPQPRVVKRETYGDWIYVCLEDPEDKTVRCSIAQQLADEKSKQSIFSWRIVQDGKGGMVGIWQTPPQVLLNRGITIDAGSPKPIAVPYERCGQRTCRAVATLAPDYIDTLSKAEKATATIVLSNGRSVNLPLSVKGLADGLTALKQAAPPAPG
jgi:invasion protein IalB